MAIPHWQVLIALSVAFFVMVLSDEQGETWAVNDSELNSEYFKQELLRYSEKPRLEVPIKVRILYNSLSTHAGNITRLFHNLMRDTRAWKPIVSVCAADCQLDSPCNVSLHGALFEVTCNGTSSIYQASLDGVVSSKDLRRILIKATDRCDEFDEVFQKQPYDLAVNLSQARVSSSETHSVVLYLESPKEKFIGRTNLSRPLIRELWLDSLNQSHMVFLWVAYEGITDELHVAGKNSHVGFFDEDAVWQDIEQGMRMAFRFMYELTVPRNDSDEIAAVVDHCYDIQSQHSAVSITGPTLPLMLLLLLSRCV